MKENLNTGGKYSIGVFGKKLIGVDTPTTDRVLGDFAMVQMNWIESGGKIIKKFLPKLTQRQEDLLRLAGVPISEYQKDWNAIPGV